MTTCTKAEFARMRGVSKAAVQKWQSRGWLEFQGTLVDVEASDALLTKYRDSTDPRAVGTGNGTSKPSSKPRSKPPKGEPSPVAAANTVLPNETPAQAAERIVIELGADMNIEEARRVKENYLALHGKLEYEQDAGLLIEIDLARKVIFDAARGARDAWLNWPGRVAPMIAADLGIEADRVSDVLTAYVHKQLAAISDPDGEFRKG